MIILGPPLESREQTRLRSATLEEFTRTCLPMCVRCVSLFRAEGRPKSCPSTHALAIFASSHPSFFLVCVCMCVFTAPASYVPLPRGLSPTNPRLLDGGVCDFLYGSSCLIFRCIACLTRARPVVSSGRPILCLFTCR